MAETISFFSSLRFRFALLLVLFAGTFTGGTMILVEQHLSRALVRESIDKGLGIAQGLAFNAEDPLLTGDDLYLFSAVRSARQAPGIRYAVIVDENRRVLASERLEQVGQPFALPGAAPFLAEGAWRVVSARDGDVPVFDLAVPILTVSEPRLRLGEIHLGLGKDLIGEAVAGMRLKLVLLAGLTLALGGGAAWVLASYFVRPVAALVDGVRAIGAGNLEQRLSPRRRDEIGLLTGAFNEMAQSLREKEFIKNTFERYVSKPLAEQILRHRDELRLGGEEREVTILFADIRRFTAIAEQYPAARVVEMLNAYFGSMLRIINEHEGMVDKLMGDAVMALFGAPIALGDDPLRAVRCALAMQDELTRFNATHAAAGFPALQMGIGINTGLVIAGNIGSATRMEYTVIGDSVNIAARLQGLAGAGEVVISGTTLRKVEGRVRALPREPIALRGKARPVEAYQVTGLSRE